MPIHTEARASKKRKTEPGARVMGKVGWRCFSKILIYFYFLAKTYRIDFSDKVTSEMLDQLEVIYKLFVVICQTVLEGFFENLLFAETFLSMLSAL